MNELLKYDEDLCTTAGAFRRMGFTVKESIPDCAWVPNWAIHYKCGPAHSDKPHTISMDLICNFDIPFRHCIIKYTLEKEGVGSE